MTRVSGPSDLTGILVAVLSSLVYGFYPIAARGAYADGANPVFLILLVAVLRAALLAIVCRVQGKRLFQTRTERKIALVAGLFQTVSIVVGFFSLAYIPGAVMLVIVFTFPFMLLVVMAFRGEIKLSPAVLLPAFFAYAGLVLVIDLGGHQSAGHWYGVVLAFVGAIALACRFYIFEGQMKTRDPLVVGTESFWVTVLIVPALLFWELPAMPHSLGGLGWSLVSGMTLSVGMFLSLYGIALLGAFRFGLFAKSEPVFTAIFAVLFLGERLKTSQYIGMAAVMLSLVAYQYMAQKYQKKKQRHEHVTEIPSQS